MRKDLLWIGQEHQRRCEFNCDPLFVGDGPAVISAINFQCIAFGMNLMSFHSVQQFLKEEVERQDVRVSGRLGRKS